MAAFRQPTWRPAWMCLRCSYSTTMRNDMKTAMKAKDKSRLDALRGLISDVTNAAKTSKPITTDSQMVGIIRKRIKNSESAVAEFQAAKRDDLTAQESAQLDVLNEYIRDLKGGREEDIIMTIQDVIGKMKTEKKTVNQGSVMKALVGLGGPLEESPADKSDVARLVGGMI
ncbi:hypothetical protein ACLMJK_005113 [Lecanora helva]